MHFAALSLISQSSVNIDPEVVVGILWAHATSSDGLQHVRARAGPGRVDVAIFCTAETPTGALNNALRLCRRAARASPLLSGVDIREFSGKDEGHES
jgi:hypothetical protein